MPELWTPPSSRGATEVAPGIEVEAVAEDRMPGPDDVLYLPPKGWDELTRDDDGRTIPSLRVEYEHLRQACLNGQMEPELFGFVNGFGPAALEVDKPSPDGYVKFKRPCFHVAFFTDKAPDGWVDTASDEGFAFEFIDPKTGEPDCWFATGKMTRHDNPLWIPGTRRAEDKPGRNEPCSCGSGLKFKRCCGA